jgi:hypothetical protein
MPTTAPPKNTSRWSAVIDRTRALVKIEEAQRLLYEAAALTCPLQGFSGAHAAIAKHGDATKALWHAVQNAPLPTGHDGF